MTRRFAKFTVRNAVARTVAACAAGVLVFGLVVSGQQKPAARAVPLANEWPTYGHDQGGMRYSPLTQITPANVNQLKPAWVYHMKPPADAATPSSDAPQAPGGGLFGRGAGGFAAGETTPLIIRGIMYVSTPYGRVVALDPTDGKEMWVFKVPTGNPSTRGVEYFAGDSVTSPQIVFG